MNATESELTDRLLLLERKERQLRSVQRDFMDLMLRTLDLRTQDDERFKRDKIRSFIDILIRGVK